MNLWPVVSIRWLRYACGYSAQVQAALQPNVFVDISATLETKVQAMEVYESETRPFPHPRSPEALQAIARRWGSVVGLGAAVALGACIVEKHFTLSRDIPGPDSAFSLEPHEFREMVDAVRVAEKALGEIRCEVTEREAASRVFRRSLFVVQDVKAGEVFTPENVRSLRPGYGLHTRYLGEVLGRRAARDIERGTPLSWDLVV